MPINILLAFLPKFDYLLH